MISSNVYQVIFAHFKFAEFATSLKLHKKITQWKIDTMESPNLVSDK